MEESKNTPPHAELVIRVSSEIDGMGLSNIKVEIRGCKNCLSEGMANHLLSSEPFKELINKTVRRANELRAQKEN